MTSGPAPELTVYYDGSCPLCRREIALYQRQRGAEQLAWHDISAGAPTGPGLSCEAAMRRFHVRDAQGRLHDPCVLDTFMAAHDFMNGGFAQPWWHFTEQRKKLLGQTT